MAGPSQYLQAKLLSQAFGATAWSAPATVYIGLSTVADSTGNVDATLAGGEPTIGTGSYARIAVTNNTTNFPAASGSNPSTSKLHVAFSFPASSAAWSTGATAQVMG
ncbi:MAG: phage tail fiber protein, partial [Candidatus Dormibacteria bacterium]